MLANNPKGKVEIFPRRFLAMFLPSRTFLEDGAGKHVFAGVRVHGKQFPEWMPVMRRRSTLSFAERSVPDAVYIGRARSRAGSVLPCFVSLLFCFALFCLVLPCFVLDMRRKAGSFLEATRWFSSVFNAHFFVGSKL